MTVKRTVPRAPNGLQRRGKALWTDLHTTFDFADEPHRRVLVEDACREADLVDRLQRAVDKNDLRVKGSTNQPVPAPELTEIRLHRKALADMLRALALPDAEDD